MFWPFVLPAEVTFCLLLVLYVAAVLIARRYHKAYTMAFDGAVIAFLAFIPCCAGVKAIIDPYRFGVFEYPNHTAISQYPVQMNLPDAATAITVGQQWGNFRAKFTIEQGSLDDWFDRQWATHGDTSRTQRQPIQTISEYNSPESNHNCGLIIDLLEDLGWSIPKNAFVYRGPMQDNGRGFFLFYDAPSNIAYQFMGYW